MIFYNYVESTLEVHSSDIIRVASGEKHWHALTMGMTHMAIQEYKDAKAVYWDEQVSDK